MGFGLGFDFGLGFGLLFGFLGEGGGAAGTLEYDEKEGTKQLKEVGNQAMTELRETECSFNLLGRMKKYVKMHSDLVFIYRINESNRLMFGIEVLLRSFGCKKLLCFFTEIE